MHLEGAPLEFEAHVVEGAAGLHEAREREVVQVRELRHRVGLRPGFRQFMRFLDEFPPQQFRISGESRGERPRLRIGESLAETSLEIERIVEAGRCARVTEAGPALSHREAQRVAVTVRRHADEFLRGAGGLTLPPEPS